MRGVPGAGGTLARSVRIKHLALVLAAVGAWTSVHATQQSPAETFRSGREVLTIDTSVRDASGRPLTDLQASDFTVRIDGELRRVLTARLFGADGGSAAKAEAPIARFIRNQDTPPGRVVVFAIDRDSIRAGSERALLDSAANMLGRLSPADAAGAIALPGAATDLTRDHGVVADAIRQMTGTQPLTGWHHRARGRRLRPGESRVRCTAGRGEHVAVRALAVPRAVGGSC
jgi:hypothetical protein